MINMKERSDDVWDEIYNFKAIHGHCGTSLLRESGFNYIPTISKDICVVSITNKPYQNLRNYEYLENPDKLNFKYIILDSEKPFKCGVDLIIPLLEYIKTIDTKYILYMDSTDVVLMSDITDPQSILDTYNCKILFNAEDGYSFPDHDCVDKTYLNTYGEHYKCSPYEYYVKMRDKVIDGNVSNLHKIVNCYPYRKSLNSGLFLGERDYLITILTIMVDYMNDDPLKGYPYGEIENQKLWQFLQFICKNNEIQIDYLNLYFLWNHVKKFTYEPDHWEHYDFFIRYINKNEQNE